MNIDAKVVLLAIRIRDRTRYLFAERCLRRFRERGQMQVAINPDAASHSHLSVFLFKLKRFEPDDERGDNVARVAREDRHSYYFVDGSSVGLATFPDVTDLLRAGQSAQGQLRLRFRIQFTHVVGIWRLNDRACAVEKPIKSRMQRSRGLFRRRFVAFHQIAQLVLRAGIQQVDCVIFNSRMDPWLGSKDVAALRQGCMAHFFDLVQRRNLGLEVLLQISFRVGGDLALRQVKTKCSQCYYDNHYRGEQPSSKACYTFASRLDR